MVRAGAPTPSKRKEKEGEAVVSAEEKAEEIQSRRLRDLAFSRKLLSRSRAYVQQPSLPSKTILKSDGKDIVKKGHRKSKYLFSFPGLLSPIAGGKLGELTSLDSKNPVLYVEFPQGRLKLFGTIMYPKNKYLTLHFQRGAGNIICEDCFESLIVFSQAWWVGTKEQNPEEVRLPLPEGLGQDKHSDIDFTAGAGQTRDFNQNTHLPEKSEAIEQPASVTKPEVSEEAESIGKDNDDVLVINQSVRQSSRNAGKTLKYADFSSESEDSDSDASEQILSTRRKKLLQAPKELSEGPDINAGVKASDIVHLDETTPKRSIVDIEKAGEKGSSKLKADAVSTKTSLKAKLGSSPLLKQSRLETFCHVDRGPQEDTKIILNKQAMVDMKAEVTTGTTKVSIKSTKRPRQVQGLKEHTKRSESSDGDDDFKLAKMTPSKRLKQDKSDQGAGDMKATASISKTRSISKVQDGRPKTQKNAKARNPATATGIPTSKGKTAVSKAVQISKESSGTQDDSDPEVASDDSEDEDYVG